MYKSVCFNSFLFFSLIFSISLSQAQVSGLPADFSNLYDISAGGVVTAKPSRNARGNTGVTFEQNAASTRVLSKGEGTAAWYVGSTPCPQNKQLNCVSVYNRDSHKIRGNQMNPLADEDHYGKYTLYRFDKDKENLHSVIKCGGSTFTTKLTRNAGNLKNCYEYTESKCKEWSQHINENFSDGDGQKAEQCISLFKKIDQSRVKMVQLFQSDLKSSQKDIESQFDEATRADNNGIRISSSVEMNNPIKSPAILTYKDLVDRSNDCSENIALFQNKKFDQRAYIRGLFNVPGVSETPASSRSNNGRSPGAASAPAGR
ncbi:MAG: hypothetical protein ABL930_06865 [Pseudobdellovibrio sp.]